MPVAVEMSYRGVTREQYDQVIAKMGLRRQGPAPPGALFHWAAQTDEGMHIVDVWESREVFDRFAQEQIGPYSREVGIEVQPEMRFFDVHNYVIAGS